MPMIRSFRHKGLKKLFETGSSAKVNRDFHPKAIRQLDALDSAARPQEMNIPGWDFHGLHGKPKRYSVHVNGPWCITFEWDEPAGDAIRVNLEQYH